MRRGGVEVTSEAAVGYMILAARLVDLKQERIEELADAMAIMFSKKDKEAAEQVYNDFLLYM